MNARALILTLTSLWALPVRAADVRSGERVEIVSGSTLEDDLYIAANTVLIEGAVIGDVIVLAENLTIRGDIRGTVIGAAKRVFIDGRIERGVRLAGNEVQLGPSSRIVGDALVAAADCTIAGDVARDALLASSEVRVTGRIHGRSRMFVERLWLAESAQVGALKYYSPTVAAIAPGAQVTSLERQATRERPRNAFGFGWWAAAAAAFVTGACLLRIGGAIARRPADSLRSRPGASVGYGALCLFALPIAAIIAMVTVVGIPLGILALGLLIAGSYLAYLVTAYTAGEWTLTRVSKGSSPSPYAAMAVGVLLFALAGRIPGLGGLIGFAAVLFGLGAIWVSILGSRSRALTSMSAAQSAAGSGAARGARARAMMRSHPACK